MTIFAETKQTMQYKTNKQIERERDAQVLLQIAHKAKAQAPENSSQAGIIRAVQRAAEGKVKRTSFTHIRETLMQQGFTF